MKIVLLFSALFSLSSSVAQDNTKKIEMGFGGGGNYSFESPKPQSGKQFALPGFHIGLGAKFNLSKRFFLIGQASFIKQFTKYSYNNLFTSDSIGSSHGSVETTNSYSWIALPMQVNYLIGNNKTKNFFFGLGFSPRRLLSSKTNIIYYRPGGPVVNGSPIGDRNNEWNLFASVQTGFRLSLNQGGTVLISLSYERSIFDVEKKYTLPANSTFDYNYVNSATKMNSFSLGVSYCY